MPKHPGAARRDTDAAMDRRTRSPAAGTRAAALAVATSLALALAPSPAGADELRLDAGLDAAMLAAGAVLALTLELMAVSGELEPQSPGNLSDVNPLDRWVAEGSSSGTGTPHDVSNVLFAIACGAAALMPLSTGLLDGADAGWTDLVLVLEAITWNASVANLVKLAVRRPRPISYVRLREGSFDPDETDGSLSFYSGHTSTVATVAAALTTTDFLRRPRGCPRPWIVLFSGAAATLATGAMRVAAKRHFVTDVAVGAALGTAIGVAVPLLHRTRVPALPSVSLVPGGATVGLSGVL
jgi:membrane-associated phospholipid phosphatase